MWPSTLSGRLLIVALVGRCPANQLIRRGPIPHRPKAFHTASCEAVRLCGISSRFRLLSPCVGQVAHALLTRPPLSHGIFHSEKFPTPCFVRLACVKHAASVHPEPGSNSHHKFVPASPASSSFPRPPLLSGFLYCFRSHLFIECCSS